GVNTSADAVNRLAVKSDVVLLSHDDMTPGSGDMRVVVNKKEPSNTSSLVFQSNWGGRAELGLSGTDAFNLKTSVDGNDWKTPLAVDAADGSLNVLGLRHTSANNSPMRTFIDLPAADGVTSFWRMNETRDPTPRRAVLSDVSAGILTLNQPIAQQFFFESYMRGVSYVRVWNTSKQPLQSAWLIGQPSASSLEVLDPTDIADWLPGDTIQLGEPASSLPNSVCAIDISPMMQNTLDAVFPQSGVLLKVAAFGGPDPQSGLGQESSVLLSPTGEPGSFFDQRSRQDGSGLGGQFIISSTLPSPVSNSNLVLLKENGKAGAVGICLATAFAILA
ncbi:MAG: hypothetical protein AAFN68_13015, partial [Pseudomonadota bacterium]